MRDYGKIAHRVGEVIYMLLIFLFVADPTNTILGLKNVVFALFFLYNIVFIKADWYKIKYFLIPVLAVTLSWIFAVVQRNNIDMERISAVYTAFVPLLLLLWSDRYNVLKLSVLPVSVSAIIVLLLFWMIIFFPITEGPIYMFMWGHENTIMMSNRYILGFKFFCMYPKSAVAMLPVLGYSLYNLIRKEKRNFANILVFCSLLHMFLISGTRSSVLFSVFLVAAILFVYCRNGRYMRYVAYPSVFFFFVIFVAVLVVLLMETDEYSNMVKYAHLESYSQLFQENPLYLLFGQGPATDFYTAGFNKFSYETEWTYIELIRNYGLLSLMILFVVLYPLVVMFRNIRREDSVFVMVLSYIVYLIIAGTNPLLLSSTGMLVVLTMYSYITGLPEKRTVQD